MTIDDLWYRNNVMYSLDLETFMDADGDGIGDFEGLMRRLDYLHSLGVGTLWLNPFQKTPNRDNGYDISDYYGVDSRHGSPGTFVQFMHEAKERGIRVIMDLVVNHTSDQHLWFRKARGDKESRYRDWYVWSEDRPEDWDEGVVFPGVQEATWTYDEEAGEYYFHRFYRFQPDLNVDNPEVRSEIRRIIGYWLELGVSGFRVDAVPFLIESTKPGNKRDAMNFEYLYEIRRFLQWRRGNALLLGEANVSPEENVHYFGPDGEGIHMMFNFFVNQNLFYALATGEVKALAKALEATRKLPPMAQWAQFLRNHDELDLGRLTDEQRRKVFDRFGPDESMQLYDRGIRRRLAPMLGSRERLELAYSMLFSLPGAPVLRYGDEIGMGEDLSLPERQAVRTPMQWSDDRNGGFSLAENTVLPVVSRGERSFQRVNVEAQRRDRDSLLNWTTRMIRLRKECPEIGWGEWTVLDTGSPHVLGLRYDWLGTSLVVLHNFASQAQAVHVRPEGEGGETLVNLLVEERSRAGEDGAHHLKLDGYGYRWYRLGSLQHLAYRRSTQQPDLH